MAKGKRPPKELELPADWTPVRPVDNPVINKPYEVPQWHWIYQGGVPSKQPGRRSASYWFKSKKTGSATQELFAEEERDDLPLVNALRADVDRWRESGYRGASQVTKDLFSYWFRLDRPRPLFFCQREAIETLVYLLEIAIPGRLGTTGFRNFQLDQANVERLLKGERPGFQEFAEDFFPRLIDVPADASLLPLRRLGCKMATGSGKTLVMAMLIAWAFCNRGRNPATTTFPNAVLVCAPNLTVKGRLEVLKPGSPGNHYEAFDLVPAKYRELLGVGRVLVTNWHGLAPKSEHQEGGTSYRVVDKGAEPDDAFTKDRLGDLATRLPLLVLNDEGHHCWRPKGKLDAKGLTKEEREALEDEAEEARVWLSGIDRINNAGLLGAAQPCVLATVDLSATPFYLGNSGYPEGSPFPWLVSDFGLVDAIESGIVKIPRLPVKDDAGGVDDAGRPDPKYFRLWRHIDDNLGKVDRVANGRPKPEAVYREGEGALITLATQWKKRLDQMRASAPAEDTIPPVMIVVCDNTEIAQVFFEHISGETTTEVLDEKGKVVERTVYGTSAIFDEFSNTEELKRTVRIDTKLLAKIETGADETKDEAAQALRDILNSVGRRGGSGEQVRCVVSVSMLTEGWDATNVTHILGVRAFGSQLLCEQVVGRGLRRMNYVPDRETGMLAAEYVDVYGIPFSLIPYKGKPQDDSGVDVVYNHIYALPERAHLEIRMPVVESYTYDLRGSGIKCDVDKLEGFIVDHEPTEVYLVPTRGYQDGPGALGGDYVKQTRDEFYQAVRYQQVLFRLTQLIVDDLIAGAQGEGAERIRTNLLARQQVFPEVLRIVQTYIETKVTFANGVDRRELALQKYAELLCERVRDGIVPAGSSTEASLVPIVNSFHPFVSTKDVNYRTPRPVVPLVKSHLNKASFRSKWERDAIELFDELDVVEAYAPNDRQIGLVLPYEYAGESHYYEPDFIVRLRDGQYVMFEVKGKGGEIHDEDRVLAKNAAAKKWVTAVNNTKGYGRWCFEICKDLGEIRQVLGRLGGVSNELPFRFVRAPTAAQRFKTCVPLTSLKAAAGYWSEEQQDLEGVAALANEWVEYGAGTAFEAGMFVARVSGDSMEPEIPANSYCLFRQPRAGSRNGRRLLVWHEGVTDSETGGQYTVKVYQSEKVAADDGGWQHGQVTLKPLNPAYDPIVLKPEHEGSVRVLAEFVEVVGPA